MKKIACILLLTMMIGCKKFVDIDPPKTQVISATVYTSDENARAALTGIYIDLMNNNNNFASGGISSVTMLLGLSADEFMEYSTNLDRQNFYSNNLQASSDVKSGLWDPIYKTIYYTHAVLEGLQASIAISQPVKQQLEGEARFLRAFCYFYLVNIWGEVPLATGTDYRVNTNLHRSPVSAVYELIDSDLHTAQGLLPTDYSGSAGEKTRPNRWAATTLLARTQLYRQQWSLAESSASAVINSAVASLPTDLATVFKKNSAEAIWQLSPVTAGRNTWEGLNFILVSTPSFVSLRPALVNGFETGDSRKTTWITSFATAGNTFYYPFKYKIRGASNEPLTEYSMVIRLAESYLIRAEARARQDKLAGCRADLDLLRNRASLPPLPVTITRQECLQAVARERQSELFSEWGHRWLDLKRTGAIDSVMAVACPQKGGNWQPYKSLYPIPQTERNKNIHLTQNDGY